MSADFPDIDPKAGRLIASRVPSGPLLQPVNVSRFAMMVHELKALGNPYESNERMEEYLKRYEEICRSAGFRAFVDWAELKLGRAPGLEAIEELYSRLGTQAGKRRAEVHTMNLEDAVRLIEQAEQRFAAQEDHASNPQAHAKMASDGDRPPGNEVWLKVGEAAKIAGEPPWKITRAVQDGKLTNNGKKGHACRIDPAALSLWVLAERNRDEKPEADERVKAQIAKNRGR